MTPMGRRRRSDANTILLAIFVLLACASYGASQEEPTLEEPIDLAEPVDPAEPIEPAQPIEAGADDPHRELVVDNVVRKVFDVTAFGAKPLAGAVRIKGRLMAELPGGGDPTKPIKGSKDSPEGATGKEDTSTAFIRTWVAACRGNYKGPAKVVIPPGVFLTGPVVFQGPCTSSKTPIMVEIQGEIRATTDLSQYTSPEWLMFEDIDGLIVTGNGVVNGQGEKTWRKGGCDTEDCARPPSSLKFISVKNVLIEKITSLNSKYFHYHVTDSLSVTLNNVLIIAPGESPNTDGCHISDSDNVKVINSIIGTGDDCVSIGQGSTNILVNNVTCGPGHGLSVGSLGKYKNEKPLNKITITNSRLFNTTNGARIKTWANDYGGSATGILFENLIMDRVKNPIIIDQSYGVKKYKNNPTAGKQASYKLRDVVFRNIKGTTWRNIGMSLVCSGASPCEGVRLSNIDLKYGGPPNTKSTAVESLCFNARVTMQGLIKPAAPVCK